MDITCACGSLRSIPATGNTHIDWCPSCGTGATAPPPERDVHGDGLFEDPGAGYGGDRLARQKQWMSEAEVRLAWLKRFLPVGGKLLEIGSASGEFVVVAENAGFPTVGLETSPWAAKVARQLTPHVYEQDLSTWMAHHPQDRFDAVVMFHVLEHFSDPRPFLRELHQVMEPGGVLLLEVPNGGSPTARREDVRWWAARPEDHFFHYSLAGLRQLLLDTGWQPAELAEVPLDLYPETTWSRRVANTLRGSAHRLLGHGARAADLLRATARAKA
jgi:SAM-dependent methyltransferase